MKCTEERLPFGTDLGYTEAVQDAAIHWHAENGTLTISIADKCLRVCGKPMSELTKRQDSTISQGGCQGEGV